MLCSLLSMLAVVLPAALPDNAPAVELRYSGALSKAAQGADTSPVKRLNVYCAVRHELPDGYRLDYVVKERGAGGWAWPERFGSIKFDGRVKADAKHPPRLLYEYDGTPVAISLP